MPGTDPSTPSGWTRLIELFDASDKIGFGFFVAGFVTLIGAQYEQPPFTALKNQSSLLIFITFFTLFGAATCSVRVFGWLMRLLRWLTEQTRRWWYRRTLMTRVTNLIPFERLSLAWIAHHKAANVFGSRYDDPFRSLIRDGFITAADVTGRAQGFQVNKRLYRRTNKKKLRELCPKGADQYIDEAEPPWRRLVGRIGR